MTNWTEILISLLPLFIFIALLIFIRTIFKKAQAANKAIYDDKHNEMIGTLKEIRDELKELNKNNSQKM
ncbi:MAG: hypothetical protein C0525_12790 [Flavobacterium sp.]|uniref:hypothetical protein n=1 Tax=unclassified Flavobacterium TaxID=196869 RepID=UPI000EAC6064|nr:MULTISPECIES: hypothetical protein [unclassified Flavobacterium]MBA4135594.1 hypothetical protein [Flavobacterium sp.]RKS02307.1 hypothetical protein C8C84_2017 [Flavobacterium sp. 102]